MRAYIDVTGRNQEEATSRALAKLGLDRDDVSVEVLEREKSGFLGFGSSPAKVRVYYGPEDEEEILPPAPAAEELPAGKLEPSQRTERLQEKKEPERPQRMEQFQEEEKSEPLQEEKEPERPPEKQEEKRRPAPEEPGEALEPLELGQEADDEKARAIRKFLEGLLAQMECPAEIHVYLPEKGRYKVVLTGSGLGSLIGRRGETLDAIQQITSYAVNRTGARVRIHLDAENYRARREQSLRNLARKVAARVVRCRRSVTLEPMNAYERHVIHAALQDYEGVSTHSTGTDPNRRVVVTLDRDK